MKSFKDEVIKVWNLAWPTILANVSIPLIGATNIAVVGRMNSATYIGGVALGVVILQCIYWSFSFLRRGTTGITAQAYGANDKQGICSALIRSLLIAVSLGLLVTALQWPISWIGFKVLQGSPEVEKLAQEYFHIRIWASVATMGNYVMLGWFYGIQKAKTALVLRVLMNILNIPLAIHLALNLKMGVAGVAWSAFTSHIFVFVLSIIVSAFILKDLLKDQNGKLDLSFLSSIFQKDKFLSLFRINGDIFIRTVLVFMAFSWFTARGAEQGELILAVNAVLINMFYFIAYALDGFANAAETLVGEALGAKDGEHFNRAVKISTILAGVFALIFMFAYIFFGESIINVLTSLDEVRAASLEYLPWLIAMPVIGIWAFQLDGIYTGITQTSIMRNMMVISFAFYAICILTLPEIFANHGLWLSISIFMIIRAITLFLPFKKLRDKLFLDVQ